MDSKSMDSLLNPSLIKNEKVGQPFSSTAHFILSWFGGGIPAVLFCCLSAKKMGLLRKKCLQLAILFMFSIVVTIYMLAIKSNFITPPLGIEAVDVSQYIRILSHLFGVFIYGIFYLLFRKYLSSARLSGEPAPSPWLPGVACIGIGFAIIFSSAFAFNLIKTL